MRLLWIAKWFGVGLLLMITIVALLGYRFGSLSAARAYLRGEPLLFIPSSLDLGAGKRGETRNVPLQLMNISEIPVALVGASSSCGCVLIDRDLPDEILPRESRSILVKVTFTGKGLEFAHLVRVYAAASEKPAASTVLRGTIREEPGPRRIP